VGTSLATSQASFPEGSTHVVIATASSYPDALAASALAGALDAPILLVDATLSADVLAELTRLGVSDIHIVGGVSAVSGAIQTQLEQANYTVERLSGDNRYETAYKIAAKVTELYKAAHNDVLPPVAYLATGEGFADALAASSAAGIGGVPILLTDKASLNPNVVAFLGTYPIDTFLVTGGTAAVADAVTDALTTKGVTVKRLEGGNRYETADAIVRDAVTRFGITPKVLLVASGDNYPDALGGGAAAAHREGLLLLTPKDSLHPNTAALITEHKTAGALEQVNLLGGTSALTEKVHDAVKALLT
jgi:putative cell wall-binding protein